MARIAGRFAQIFSRPPAASEVGTRLAQVPEYVELGGKQYPYVKAVRVYEKLTLPRTSGEFYNNNRVRGNVDETGNVTFEVSWPELANADNPQGWSLQSPEELGMLRASPRPNRGLIQMQAAFADRLKHGDGKIKSAGAGLYFNVPISPGRANTYPGYGFVDASTDQYQVQYLDNRRFTNSPTIAELLALGDAVSLYPKGAELLRQNLLGLHPQIRDAVEARIARGDIPF